MIIYKTTNTLNGHYYIGKDARNRPWYFGSGRHLKNAIRKYGKHNFRKDILENVDGSDLSVLLAREIHWIDRFDAINDPNSYNIQRNSGLYEYVPTDEVKKRISDGIKRAWKTNAEYRDKVYSHNHGESNPMFGRTQSEYQRQRAADANRGKVVSKLTRAKLRKKAIGRTHSKETREKMRHSQKLRQLREKQLRLQCQNIK